MSKQFALSVRLTRDSIANVGSLTLQVGVARVEVRFNELAYHSLITHVSSVRVLYHRVQCTYH